MGAQLMKLDSRAKSYRALVGRVAVAAGAPSVSAGGGFTVVDTAAGKVEIVPTKPGKALISAIAIPIENTDATGFSCKIMGTPTGSSIIVGVYQHDGTDSVLVDNIGFYFDIVLQD